MDSEEIYRLHEEYDPDEDAFHGGYEGINSAERIFQFCKGNFEVIHKNMVVDGHLMALERRAREEQAS